MKTRQNTLRAIAFVIAVLIIGVLGFRIFQQEPITEKPADRIPTVSLLSLDELGTETITIQTIGKVESLNQVELKSQIAENVSGITVRIGDSVTQGQVLLTLNSTDIERLLAESEVSLQNTKDKAAVDIENDKQSALAAVQKAVNSGKNALIAITDIQYVYFIGVNEDLNLVNAKTMAVEKLLGVEDAGRWISEFLSVANGGVFKMVNEAVENPDSKDITTVVTETMASLQLVKEVLNAVPITSDLTSAERASISTEKTSISTEISAVSASQQAISVQGVVNTSAINTAQTNVENYRSQLKKTTITSPITGRVAAVAVDLNDLVSIGTPLVSIVNPDAVQIEAFINVKDAPLIRINTTAVIEGSARGFVTKIAPIVDPVTQKIEITIAVTNPGSSNLIIGQFANIDLLTRQQGSQNSYLLPLESIRITSDGAVVYIVDENNIIQEHPVIVGRVLGESIVIENNLQDITAIIASVRGLEPGTKVQTQ